MSLSQSRIETHYIISLELVCRREHDRLWVMATHPTLNLFAAGNNSHVADISTPPYCILYVRGFEMKLLVHKVSLVQPQGPAV
jgi:hypothetical protein